MQCGLLGRKLGHSYSVQIHAELADYAYRLIEKEPEELEAFLKSDEWDGLNVTIPYKKTVIPYLDALSPVAQRLGAVNTIVRRNGQLIGHNTDYFGFASMLEKSRLSVAGKKALVLGSGGASNTVCAVLQEHGAQVVVISRRGENNYQNLSIHQDASLIVNATPVGMFPNVADTPLIPDEKTFPKLEGILDVVYNPARTQLLLEGEKRGLVTRNGLWMLVAQAKESAEWFLNRPLENCLIGTIYEKLQKQMENLVLIGMPGSGKTTVGQCLAEATGKRFVDTDEEILVRTGESPEEIIRTRGEKAFRETETEILTDLGKQSALVIATGGGCVTVPENYDALHRNGRIIWLTRDLGKLPTQGRPLSQISGVEALFERRAPLYRQFADCIADNNGRLQDTVSRILEEQSVEEK